MGYQGDLQIFVTGVVGRAMGSGQFKAEDIPALTQAAYAAFQEHLAPHLAKDTPAASPSPSASQASWQGKPSWKETAAAMCTGAVVIEPETKAFSMWGGDKAYLGGKEQSGTVWGEWYERAAAKDESALKVLRYAASKSDLGDDPKWHNANKRRIARAKAILLMLQRSAPQTDTRRPVEPEAPLDETPF